MNKITHFGFAIMAFAVGFATSTLAFNAAHAVEKEVIVMTAEEKAEKEGRKACKIKMCSVLRSKKATGEEISCHIKKSMREKAIKEMVAGGKIGWQWGKMYCEFDLKIKQADLVSSVTKSAYDLKIAPHTIKCKVDRKKDNKWHDISVGIAPELKFKDGKAVEGRMNWGDVKAPLFFKSLIWPGVKLDNQVNVIGGKVVDVMNSFMTKKCDQVKDELTTGQ